MKHTINFADAQARHPQLVQSLLTDMEQKFHRAKRPMPPVGEFGWQYDWAVAIGPGSGQPPHNLFISLSCTHGQRRSALPLGTPGQATPATEVPPEVLTAMTAPRPKVSPTNTPHAAQLTLHTQTGIKTELVLDGYTKRNETYIRAQTLGEDTGSLKTLYRIEGNILVWSGGLHRKASERLEATAPGSEFRYRNIKLIRLTDPEIVSLVQGKTFQQQFM